jgi:hypothetical protein
VLFQADSPSAVTDSCYTDASGYYQVDLVLGSYDVDFTHDGFESHQIDDFLIAGATTIPTVTLTWIPQGVILAGSLSGVLIDTIYIVAGDIFVDIGESLSIESGATFLFDDYQFIVNGYLEATGTETDSISFIPNMDDVHVSSMEGSGGGINCLFSQATIRECDIISNTAWVNGGGIHCENSNPHIENCNINSNVAAFSSSMPGEHGGGGISCVASSPNIMNCMISLWEPARESSVLKHLNPSSQILH